LASIGLGVVIKVVVLIRRNGLIVLNIEDIGRGVYEKGWQF
jgi:hypothetical protein